MGLDAIGIDQYSLALSRRECYHSKRTDVAVSTFINRRTPACAAECFRYASTALSNLGRRYEKNPVNWLSWQSFLWLRGYVTMLICSCRPRLPLIAIPIGKLFAIPIGKLSIQRPRPLGGPGIEPFVSGRLARLLARASI